MPRDWTKCLQEKLPRCEAAVSGLKRPNTCSLLLAPCEMPALTELPQEFRPRLCLASKSGILCVLVCWHFLWMWLFIGVGICGGQGSTSDAVLWPATLFVRTRSLHRDPELTNEVRLAGQETQNGAISPAGSGLLILSVSCILGIHVGVG